MIDLSFVPLEEFRRARQLAVAAPARTRLFATLARVNTLYMIARAGSGHIGTSFSSIDIVSWLYLNELRLDGDEPDVYFSSKGHDVPAQYAVLLGLGLLDFERVHKLRYLDGLPGHPDVSIPYIHANTGSLGMGVSKAKGMAAARRLQGKKGRFYVLTGDGELEEGQFWESLPSAVNYRLNEITVIIDHNKIQSDTWVRDVSNLGDLERKLASFGWHVARGDGHNLEELSRLLAELKQVPDKPQVLIADTIKGKGVSFMEGIQPGEKWYRFHSGTPSDEFYLKAAAELIAAANAQLHAAGAAPLRLETSPRPPATTQQEGQRLVAAYSRELVLQAEQNPRLVVLDADLVLDTGLIPFQERFPERFIECGIAEQDMVSQASGLALQGMLPVVHSFACFLSSRPNEQIYNNATEHRKTVYVGSLAGLLPAGPGHSHQCVRDISALAAVPGLVLLEPCTEAEVALALDYCLNGTPESCYLRLVSVRWRVPFELPEGYALTPGQGVALTAGRDAVLFGYGPIMLAEAYRAAEMLQAQHGIGLRVINLPWLNRVDPVWLKETVAPFSMVFTLDNHYVTGGQGDMLLSNLAEAGGLGDRQVRKFGMRRIPESGQNPEVLKFHRLDAESLCQDIARAVKEAGHDRRVVLGH